MSVVLHEESVATEVFPEDEQVVQLEAVPEGFLVDFPLEGDGLEDVLQAVDLVEDFLQEDCLVVFLEVPWEVGQGVFERVGYLPRCA